jgi:hypothetical protein
MKIRSMPKMYHNGIEQCVQKTCLHWWDDNTFEPIFNIIYSWLPQSVAIFNQMRNLFLENILFFFFFHIQDYCFIGDVLAMFFFYAMAIFFVLKIVFFHQFFFILAELFLHIWWRLFNFFLIWSI